MEDLQRLLHNTVSQYTILRDTLQEVRANNDVRAQRNVIFLFLDLMILKPCTPFGNENVLKEDFGPENDFQGTWKYQELWANFVPNRSQMSIKYFYKLDESEQFPSPGLTYRFD